LASRKFLTAKDDGLEDKGGGAAKASAVAKGLAGGVGGGWWAVATGDGRINSN